MGQAEDETQLQEQIKDQHKNLHSHIDETKQQIE